MAHDRYQQSPTPLGIWLIQQMEAHDPPLTRTDLGAIAGVSQSTISRWILAPSNPEPGKLMLLAEALGAEYGQLLALAGYAQPANVLPPPPGLVDPAAREIDQMLHPRSPLTDADRAELRIIVEAGARQFRPKMRRRRAS